MSIGESLAETLRGVEVIGRRDVVDELFHRYTVKELWLLWDEKREGWLGGLVSMSMVGRREEPEAGFCVLVAVGLGSWFTHHVNDSVLGTRYSMTKNK